MTEGETALTKNYFCRDVSKLEGKDNLSLSIKLLLRLPNFKNETIYCYENENNGTRFCCNKIRF